MMGTEAQGVKRMRNQGLIVYSKTKDMMCGKRFPRAAGALPPSETAGIRMAAT